MRSRSLLSLGLAFSMAMSERHLFGERSLTQPESVVSASKKPKKHQPEGYVSEGKMPLSFEEDSTLKTLVGRKKRQYVKELKAKYATWLRVHA